MFTGPAQNILTEKFRLTSIANSNNVSLSTVQDGFMTLNTNLLERIRINHRLGGIPNLVLTGYEPFLMGNPYPGNSLTRIGISIDGNSPIT